MRNEVVTELVTLLVGYYLLLAVDNEYGRDPSARAVWRRMYTVNPAVEERVRPMDVWHYNYVLVRIPRNMWLGESSDVWKDNMMWMFGGFEYALVDLAGYRLARIGAADVADYAVRLMDGARTRSGQLYFKTAVFSALIESVDVSFRTYEPVHFTSALVSMGIVANVVLPLHRIARRVNTADDDDELAETDEEAADMCVRQAVGQLFE